MDDAERRAMVGRVHRWCRTADAASTATPSAQRSRPVAFSPDAARVCRRVGDEKAVRRSATSGQVRYVTTDRRAAWNVTTGIIITRVPPPHRRHPHCHVEDIEANAVSDLLNGRGSLPAGPVAAPAVRISTTHPVNQDIDGRLTERLAGALDPIDAPDAGDY